ncbi:flavoprotein [Marinitenerispora sediminis]|uniref:Flavoprotein n=1 Tax=Marinitenerispora sediminis TaxID=1931232 RepID=A0A368T195_9ACTN|nr:flavoprotein [Marinitenerispora sediminis]RCV53797.1 flavoprotein [Marinitenerispora sediminis]RCV55426.1 flavoprotein [Marinitenerispora sediminis]RCV61723.1 flavoprotein [Marinitenerispora sediminis]
MTERTLYLTVSGASTTEAEPVPDLARLLVTRGWRVTVVSTPTGVRFHDPDAIEAATGTPVRSEFRMPGTGTSLPPADALLACPWSFNSTNKTAHGIADTFAVALVCEMIGRGVPTVIVPKAGAPLARHPAFARSLADLESMVPVTVLYDPARPLPPWREVADAVSAAAG